MDMEKDYDDDDGDDDDDDESRSCYVAVTPESSTSAHSLTSSYPVVAF